MLGYMLFIIFWILLAAIWLMPIPHYSQFPLQADKEDGMSLPQTDRDAYHRAGKRYSRRLLWIFVTMVLVGFCADIMLEAHFENSAGSSPALAD